MSSGHRASIAGGRGASNIIQDILTLPFFDDFSSSSGFPDRSNWLYDSVTYTSTTAFFSDTSGGAAFWAWDFNNDSIIDNTNPFPSYNFSAPGTYWVCLTIWNSDSSCTDTWCDSVNVGTGGACNANWYYINIIGVTYTNIGGTYINNRFCVDPPTYNVATFDGLKADGAPYNFTNPLAEGKADSLVSLPIDLSTILPSDSLYISFFWQAGGVDANLNPDPSDSLWLEFLDKDSTWNWVWGKKGNTINVGDSIALDFRLELIELLTLLIFTISFNLNLFHTVEFQGIMMCGILIT